VWFKEQYEQRLPDEHSLMKVLLSAYSCLPNAGSENAVGWNWAREIAACGHQTSVITRTVYQYAIETACEKGSIQNPQFIFHDMPLTIQKIYKVPLGNYLYYLLWQYTAAKVAVRVHAKERFDLVQHITWGNFRLPSFMWKLGIPFIFGPVGGGENTPKKLRRGLGLRGRVWDFFRRASNLLLTHGPLMKSTYVHATQIVATTGETLREIPATYRHKVRIQQAVGIDPRGPQRLTDRSSALPLKAKSAKLKLLFAGRLLPWKGLHLGLKALAALGHQAKDINFTIVGFGSDESRLKRLAQNLDLGESLTWIAWFERWEDLIQLYTEFDLLVFPSLHESGGMAVLEAMSFGLPVLCLDLGGPGTSVDNTCGRVIPTEDHTEEEVVRLMSACLAELLGNLAILQSLSMGARRQIASFSWQAVVANTYGQSLVQQLATDAISSSYSGAAKAGRGIGGVR
jgi:glycosyltransferase involved in cell wall biosynthesis